MAWRLKDYIPSKMSASPGEVEPNRAPVPLIQDNGIAAGAERA